MFDTFHLSDEYIAAWLGLRALSRGNGFGPKSILRVFERFDHVKEAWEANRDSLIGQAYLNASFADKFIEKRSEIDVEAMLADLKKSGVQAIPFDHPLYPVQLRQIHEPPLILFVKGEFNEFSTHNVLSVVGTRNPSAYGQRVGKEFGRELSAKGAVVCSGMAIGIDSLAHWGAIEGGGKTIAVVATGPDICYPSSNKKLYKTILEGHGSIVSEYFPGTTPEKWHFPERNRIIAGLSSGVLVVEAGDRSGALLTAEQAFNDSRRVFAIPGRIDSQMSIGTNRLIARNVAMLVTSVDMIFEELNWVPTQYKDVRTVVELFGREKEVFDILTYEPVHFDMLCDRAKMEAGELSATLTMLELAGIVQRHPGEWYSRINQGWLQQKPTSR